jgi:hypothetical protein
MRSIGEQLIADIDNVVAHRLSGPALPQGYRGLPQEELAKLAAASHALLIRMVLVEQRELGPEDSEWMESAFDDRERAGVPIDAVLESLPGSFQLIWEEALREATRQGVDSSVVEAMGSRIFQLSNRVISEVIGLAHRRELARTQGVDRRQMAAFARLVFEGEVDHAELATFGIHPEGRYVGVHARAASSDAAAAAERTLLTAARHTGGVVGRVGGDAAGVLVQPPPSAAAAAAIGLGPSVPLSEVRRSVTLASRAADTAAAFGLEGIYSISDLRLRCPLVAEVEVGSELVDRYLAPLDALGDFAQPIIASLDAFLSNGLKIDPTARVQGIHPNTLRNRLKRFEQLTGADLRRIGDVVELWWALGRRELLTARDAGRSPLSVPAGTPPPAAGR